MRLGVGKYFCKRSNDLDRIGAGSRIAACTEIGAVDAATKRLCQDFAEWPQSKIAKFLPREAHSERAAVISQVLQALF
jgi:hypothetical protein